MVEVPVTQQTPLVIAVVTTDGQTVFDYDFRVDAVEDLRASYTAVDGTKTEFVGGVNLTATGLGLLDGGTITITGFTGTEDGQDLIIYRAIPITRAADYSRDLFAGDVNREMDRIYMILQDLKRNFDDVLRVDPGEDPPTIQSIFDAVMTSGTNASAAAGSASAAEASAVAAGVLAGNAAASATLAQRYANEAEDVIVAGGNYSAYHWSKKAEAVVLSGLVDGSVTLAKLNSGVYASKAEAEAGTQNTKLMTALRTKEAFDVFMPAYNRWKTLNYDLPSAVAEWSRNNLSSYRALLLRGFLIPSISNVIRFQISANNGSSWLSGASDHTVSYQGYTGAARADGVTTGNSGWLTIIASGAARGKSFNTVLSAWNLATEKTSISAEGGATASAHSTANFSNLLTGGCAVAANAVRVFAASGTISGEIELGGLT